MSAPSLSAGDFRKPLKLQRDNFTDNMWGGDWIPRLKGVPGGRAPVGESWEFSAHHAHPSRVEVAGGVLLPDLLARAGAQVLGEGAAARLGARAPFLLKFIDSRDDLSVQVHPDDTYAAAWEKDTGKAESWVIVDADAAGEGGHIYIGFDPRRAEGFADTAAFGEAFLAALGQANAQGPSQDPAVRARAERLVLPFLNRVRVRPGEVYDVPQGTVHAIGRGVQLFEIQQSSDLTYRVWDWNRPDAKKLAQGKNEFRELHLDRARDVLNFNAREPAFYRRNPVSLDWPASRGGAWTLVKETEGRYAADRIRLDAAGASVTMPAGFSVLTVLSGRATLTAGAATDAASVGDSWLVPAAAPALTIGGGPAELIRSYLP